MRVSITQGPRGRRMVAIGVAVKFLASRIAQGSALAAAGPWADRKGIRTPVQESRLASILVHPNSVAKFFVHLSYEEHHSYVSH
jgi:hypothetical protein